MIKAILRAIFGGKGKTPVAQVAAKVYNKPMKTLTPGAETGVLVKEPDPRAWIAGGETGIAPAVLEESGQFDVYLPDEEAQSFFTPAHFDTQSCVTFSATNDIETLINRLRAKGLLSKRCEDFLQAKGYINPQTGKVNFSDRYTAKTSGTTQAGNYLEAVGDAIRRCDKGGFGLVPESAWPMPDWDALKGKTQDEIWKIYMAEIPASVIALGKEFLEYFDVNYQWVQVFGNSKPAQLRASLKQGPFQIAAMVCEPWSSNDGMPPIQACGCGAGHATLIYGFREDKAWKDFDHYKSFRKLLAEDYCILWGLQYAIAERKPSDQLPLSYTFRIQLKAGMPESVEVRALQKALQTVKGKDGKPYMTPGVFGPYGPQTKASLGRFQSDRGIADPDGQGTNFGPSTRAAMNKALQAVN